LCGKLSLNQVGMKWGQLELIVSISSEFYLATWHQKCQ